MPYNGPDDDKLPAKVKKLPIKRRKQWIDVFESSLSSGDDESTAFAKAYGVVEKTKGYVEGWDVSVRQFSKARAEYNPVGGSEKACANCNWFVSPNSCVLVGGDISPTGISKMWTEEPNYDDIIEAVTSEKDEGWLAGLVTKLKSFFVPVESERSSDVVQAATSSDMTASPVAPVQPTLFVLHKEESGRYRFFTAYTNCFKDKHGEIFTTEAHKEFVKWATEHDSYPELHLWHAGKESKWGQCDWLDYTDGFVCASGLVDVGKEYIAERLKQEELGVSHGFIGLQDTQGNIHRYRTFEISPLPAGMGANDWAGINFYKEADRMPFSESKKLWLKEVSKIDDATVQQWETSLETLSTQLKALGIEYKESVDEEVNVVSEVAVLTKAVADVASNVATMAAGFNELKTLVEGFKQSDDEKIANIFAAEIAKLPNGVQASESTNNIVDVKQKEKDNSWFGDVLKGVTQ